jgi:hypothetical protein
VKQIIKFIFVELIFIFILLILFPASVIKEKIDVNVEAGKPILPLQAGKFYTQVINNPTHSLNSISLQFKNPLIKDNSLIYIEILDNLGELQKDFSIYGANIGDPSWIKLDFTPIDKTNLVLKVSGESQFDNTLYLFADQNGYFDLKTSYRLPGLKERILQNLKQQSNLLKQRSMWHNILYLGTLIMLNLYLAKLFNENIKKT